MGNTVTAECNNRCRASLDCPAFLIDYGLEVTLVMVMVIVMSCDGLWLSHTRQRIDITALRLAFDLTPRLKMDGNFLCPVERRPTTLRRSALIFVLINWNKPQTMTRCVSTHLLANEPGSMNEPSVTCWRATTTESSAR